MSKHNSRFVSSTREDIAEFQQASRNKNTDKSMNIWMDLLYKFHQLHGYLNEIKELDDKTLSEQLEQFIVEVCKSNGQEYKAFSLYTGFCAIAQGISERDKNCQQSDPLEIDEIKLILDSPATSTNNPKASWLKELDNSGMQLELAKEKNYAGGIKDPYAEAGSSFIPPDIPGNTYTPVTDIKKYLSKQPDDTEDDLFFVALNMPKKIYHGEWYLLSKLGRGSHDTMMHAICKDAELDFKGCTITNYSMRSTGIQVF
ncbi:zinc finger mym-type protein 2-like: PROVISIONAL [Gigaspora margarita]|uniref:Zinc finger mym-type protein 2-like: PROVISIONAL n=1 Tax=Gigaspora margarita TaxID=4874 RepID=A0A8H4ANB4_GIGMA|nr:zinc finger mym-type protein 2-like: PROVISIONAL [Gigaspora margarita]